MGNSYGQKQLNTR